MNSPTPLSNTPESETPEGATPLAEFFKNLDTPEGEAAPPEGEVADTPPEGDAPGTDEKAAPVKFNDLAEATGLDLDALYALEISSNEGEPLTIQDLKNLYSEQETATIERLQWEETKAAEETQLREAQNELAALLGELPEGAVSKERLEALRERNTKRLQAEYGKTLESISEWQDEDTREKELQGMAEYMKSFGYPLDYLSHVTDHRQFVFIRSAWQREQRIKRALAKVTPKAPDKQPERATTDDKVKTQRNNTSPGLEGFFSNL